MRWHVITCTQTAKQFPQDMHRLVILSSYPQDMPRRVILMLLKVHKSSSNFHRTFTDVTLISLRDTNIITHTSQTTSHTIHTDTTWMSFDVFHELWSNIHRIHTNITCPWIANMNVTTCTWIANMWHECHYTYMNCKHVTWIAKQRPQNTHRPVILISWGHRLDNMVTPNPPFLTHPFHLTFHHPPCSLCCKNVNLNGTHAMHAHIHAHTHTSCVQQNTPVFTIFCKGTLLQQNTPVFTIFVKAHLLE